MRLLLILLLFPSSAYAYIDPGSGMFILQSIFAALGALLFLLKNPLQALRKLLSLFKKK